MGHNTHRLVKEILIACVLYDILLSRLVHRKGYMQLAIALSLLQINNNESPYIPDYLEPLSIISQHEKDLLNRYCGLAIHHDQDQGC